MEDVWEGVRKAAVAIAPILGNAIIPGGGGIAASLIASALDCEAEPHKMEAALLNATPAQREALVEAQMSHKERLIELGIERDKVFVQDVQSAREREQKITEATGKPDKNLYVLAWINVVCFFALMATMMFIEIPAANNGPVNQLFGALVGGYTLVLGYFFGTSKSSGIKDSMLHFVKKGK